jgi:hypothetical protein
MIHNLTKKNYMELYKKVGEPAIYVKHWNEPLLVPFADGAIAGGDIFKTLYGIADYSKLPIIKVENLPYPIASYSVKTI